MKLPRLLLFSSMLIVLTLTWFASKAPDSIQANSLQTGAESATATPMVFPTLESWIRVDLPEDATQLQYGAEIYRLVCSACHAYDGTGLTDEWRATWTHDAQNCWQSKCHASNHPPDGFYLPYSPPIVGPIIPARFETAYDLFVYNFYMMPWHNPHSLTEEEAWAVTAHVLSLNEIDPGPFLDAESASNIRLRSAEPTVESTPTPEPAPTVIVQPPAIVQPTATAETNARLPLGPIAVGIIIISIVAVILYFIRRPSPG